MKILRRLFLPVSLAITLRAPGLYANAANGGDFQITKSLMGASGPLGQPTLVGGNHLLSFAWGEESAAAISANADHLIASGYFGGRFGSGLAFRLLSARIGHGAKTFYQDGLQVGVPLDASVELIFSDLPQAESVAAGVHLTVAVDHLGRSSDAYAVFHSTVDVLTHSITLSPQDRWRGNTLYRLTLSPDVLSIDGFTLAEEAQIWFLTAIDPKEENVVLQPWSGAISGLPVAGRSSSALSIRIPPDALADFSMVLVSRDPLSAPLQTDPAIIEEATRKARAGGGDYRTPVAIQEIRAFRLDGELMETLSKPVDISIRYDGLGASGLVRPRTLAFWVLDKGHHLWVKIPAREQDEGNKTLSARVSALSVFALMGTMDGSALDSLVFPNPWRPHGPKAGEGPGQTGTEAGGLTFSNLPSECRIRIFTLSGELVRELIHSDTAGRIAQESWNAETSHGNPVASGVYVWHVQSSVDNKVGKLMIIR